MNHLYLNNRNIHRNFKQSHINDIQICTLYYKNGTGTFIAIKVGLHIFLNLFWATPNRVKINVSLQYHLGKIV